MAEDREQRIRERAHRLWEEEGRPGGRAHEHWEEAERQVAEEEAAIEVEAPDARTHGVEGHAPADPLRNPEPIPPAEDPVYPAVTGPEAVPPIPGAEASLNPAEEVTPRRSSRPPRASERSTKPGAKRTGSADVKLRRKEPQT